MKTELRNYFQIKITRVEQMKQEVKGYKFDPIKMGLGFNNNENNINHNDVLIKKRIYKGSK